MLDLNLLILIALSLGAVYGAWRFYDHLSAEDIRKEKMDESFSSIVTTADEDLSEEENEDKKFIMDFIDSHVADRFPGIGKKCVHAGLPFKAHLWLLIVMSVSITVSIAAFFYISPKVNIVVGVFITAALFFVLVGGSNMLLEFFITQRTMKFDQQFGVALDVMAAALRAGSTFMNGLKFVSSSMGEPLGREFALVAQDLGLGIDIPAALDRFKERVASKNLFLFVVAIKVATFTGAALAPTFTVLSGVVTERFRLQGLIDIAVAENSAGILFLASCPWVILPFLASAWPEAYAEFFQTLNGQIVSCGLFVWYAFGVYSMYKTVKSIDN